MTDELVAHLRRHLRARHGIRVVECTELSVHSFNTVFRVDAEIGTFAARVGTGPRIHPVGVEVVEAAWLDVLTGSAIVAPRTFRTLDGAASSRLDELGHVVSVFRWVEGAALPDEPSSDQARHLGRLLAELHEVTAAHPVDPALLDAAPRFDRVRSFGDPTALAPTEPARRALLTEAEAVAQADLDASWREPPHPPHLLHGDLGSRNVVVDIAADGSSALRPIDFQDLRIGFDVQDLGLTVADLDRRWPALVAPVLDGYRSVRPHVVLSPEARRAAGLRRTIDIMNLSCQTRKPGHEAFLTAGYERLEQLLRP